MTARRFPSSLSLAAAVVAVALASAPVAAAPTATDDATWSPRSSERLVKLPPAYLRKAVEQDYARSPLAAAESETREKIRLKVQALEDLRGAIERADGDLRTELRHQFLAEKRAYLELVARDQKLRRQQAETKIRVYEHLLDRIKREHGAFTPQRAALIAKQTAARTRFESSLGKVDAKLFRSSIASESRYAREYAKNVAAIEQLVQAIKAHPMNEQPTVDGAAVTREDVVRGLIEENQATLAVLDQERTIVGYMAKLVALDALALSEDVAGGETASAAKGPSEQGITDAVEFFVTR